MTNKVLKGHRRLNTCPKRIRKPITYPLLQRILQKLDFLNDQDSLMLATLFSTAFFGLVRLGDLTKHNNIRTDDITFYPNLTTAQRVTIHIHSTKTEQFEGQDVILGHFSSPFSPVFLLRFIFETYKPPPNKHFFLLKNKTRLSKDTAVLCLRNLLTYIGENPNHYSGHSFRKGGAQQASNQHFKLSEIKELGQWKSRSYFTNFTQRSNFTRRLARSVKNPKKTPSKSGKKTTKFTKATKLTVHNRNTKTRRQKIEFFLLQDRNFIASSCSGLGDTIFSSLGVSGACLPFAFSFGFDFD